MYKSNNIYTSRYSDYVEKDAFVRSENMYKKAKKPSETGVIDPNIYKRGYISSLTGENIDVKNFKHNNMQPFLKGNITQNIEQFTTKLDMNTGIDNYRIQKREVENIFEPTPGLNNINGSKLTNNYYRERIEPSKIKNNTLPFEKINVGPGLNKGYTSSGSGGFQQNNSLDYARPKTLDELRSKVNQKNTIYELPFQAPAKGTDRRAIIAPFVKNKPETTYKQSEEDLFKTTGSILKESNRPEQAIKKTYRQNTHIEYQGGIVNVREMSNKDDYGKENITIYNNERQETQTKTVVSNVTSIVKAVISPLFDILKISTKEYLVEAPRAGGNPNAQIPSKLSIINKDDNMKTTIKETLLHDNDNLNLTGADKSYSAIQDNVKTTVKETLLYDNDSLNLIGADKSYSAIQDDIKTTVKETLIHDSQNLNVKSLKYKGYIKNEDKTKTTIKETLPVQENIRNIGKGTYRVYTYDPDAIVKKTIKETTIKGSTELGFIGRIINNILGTDTISELELKNTNKQYTSDNQEYGIAKSTYDYRPTSREAEENAEIDDTREQQLIDAGHTPNPGNMNIPIDKSDISMKTNKLLSDSYAPRDTSGNIGVIYQSSPILNECSITKDQDVKNAYENRLDGNILHSLYTNDYNISINPILDISK